MHEHISPCLCSKTTSWSAPFLSSVRMFVRSPGKQIELAAELRRPGRHRHRERTALQRPSLKDYLLFEQQTATSEILGVIASFADRGAARSGRDRGERLPAVSHRTRVHLNLIRRRHGATRGHYGRDAARMGNPYIGTLSRPTDRFRHALPSNGERCRSLTFRRIPSLRMPFGMRIQSERCWRSRCSKAQT